MHGFDRIRLNSVNSASFRCLRLKKLKCNLMNPNLTQYKLFFSDEETFRRDYEKRNIIGHIISKNVDSKVMTIWN